MSEEKILVLEDEKDLAKLLDYNLKKEGYSSVLAYDGESGLALFHREKPDLVILDLMLPKMDGLEFLKRVRRESETPVLILTAKKAEMDRILGLELGADDYVTKPYSVREVLARIKSILKRVKGHKDRKSVIKIGQLQVDLERYEIRLNKTPVTLSSKEFEFLKILIEADGKVLSRDHLLEHLWGYDRSMDLDTRTVDQHISRLRDKLGSESKRIMTVKNVGYRIKME